MGECFLVRRGGDNKTKLNKDKGSSVASRTYMPKLCTYFLEALDLSGSDTSNITDMSYMFANCEALTTLDLSSFDTSNVTNMSYMFYNCYSLTTLDLSSFDTSKVTNTEGLFYGCGLLETVYCKDEAAKTKFEASKYHSSTITFIVGKPS